jgi:hypothetical protein
VTVPPGVARLAEVLGVMLGACLLSLIYKPDNNWDLRSYHIYNPFALLEGRVSRDLYAAGSQTYFNPFLDVPYYLLAVHLIPRLPRLVAFLSGIPLGLITLIVLRLARIALPAALPRRTCMVIGTAAAGLTGTATISEIGTTFGDIPVAVLLLGGLMVPLGVLQQDRGGWYGAVVFAALLGGIAAGLKPVACIFAPGACLGLAVVAGGTRRFMLTGLTFSLAWLTGFAVAFGPWGLTVAHLFSNPIFPLMNDIFASPWIPPVDGRDNRFLPRGIWQALFYPFFWLGGRPFVVAEIGVRDPRFALAYLSLAVILFHTIRQFWRHGRMPTGIVGKPAAALCIFFVISFIVWEAMFSILRYILALEVITGILMTLALSILLGGLPRDSRAGRTLVAVGGIVLIAVFTVSSRPGWGRLRLYGTAVFDVQAPVVPDRSAVVFVTRPTAFIAPFLKGNDLVFIGLDDIYLPSRLSQEATRRILSRPNIVAVIHDKGDDPNKLTTYFGFRILTESCVPIHSANQPDLKICSCERTASG